MTTSPITCFGCQYDLTGLDAAGRCPECGRPIAESLAPAWVNTYHGMPKPQARRLQLALILAGMGMPLWLLYAVGLASASPGGQPVPRSEAWNTLLLGLGAVCLSAPGWVMIFRVEMTAAQGFFPVVTRVHARRLLVSHLLLAGVALAAGALQLTSQRGLAKTFAWVALLWAFVQIPLQHGIVRARISRLARQHPEYSPTRGCITYPGTVVFGGLAVFVNPIVAMAAGALLVISSWVMCASLFLRLRPWAAPEADRAELE